MRCSLSRTTSQQLAFTLIELVIVIVVIAILVAIAVPQYRNFTEQGKDSAVQSDVKVTVTAIKANAQTQTRNADCAQATATLISFLQTANPDMARRITAAPAYMSAVTQTAGRPISVYSDGNCTWSVAGRSDSGAIIAYGEELVSGNPISPDAIYRYSRSGYGATVDDASNGGGGSSPGWAATAVRAGGTGSDVGYAVSALADGASFAAGSFSGTASFGSTSLTSTGGDDIVVTKINADGTWAWATKAGGAGGDVGVSVSPLADGSALVSGYFAGTASFGTTTLASAANFDVFVAKINADGTWAWAAKAGGSGADYGRGVSALADGAGLVTGYLSGTVTFGSTSLTTSASTNDVFVAKINADGTWAWATLAGGTTGDYGRAISVSADGSAVATGYFQGTASFGSTSLTSAGNFDVYVAKIDASGNWAWATKAGGSSGDFGYGVSTTTDGSALVTGSFQGTATFGSTSRNSAGINDVFVAKINADGTWAWTTRAGGTGADYGYGVSATTDGACLITGYLSGTASFGSTSLTSSGISDIVVAKANPDGTWGWATGAGGAGNDYGYGVSVLADNSSRIVGSFTGTADFGSTSLTSAGSDEFVVATLNSNGTWGS